MLIVDIVHEICVRDVTYVVSIRPSIFMYRVAIKEVRNIVSLASWMPSKNTKAEKEEKRRNRG